MDLNLSNGSDYSSDTTDMKSPLNRQQQITNNNNHHHSNHKMMTSSMMSHDSYVHYNGAEGFNRGGRNKNSLLRVFVCLNGLLIILLAVFITLYFHSTMTSHDSDGAVCDSKECVQISSRKYFSDEAHRHSGREKFPKH